MGDLYSDIAKQYANIKIPGMVEPGTLDLSRRPFVKNADGSTSTVRSMGVNLDNKEYLIPTVSQDGRILGEDEAIDYFRRTGEHMGVYSDPNTSTEAGDLIHRDQMIHEPVDTLHGMSIAPVERQRNSRGSREQEVMSLNDRISGTSKTGQSFIREGEAKAQGAQQGAQAMSQSKANAQEIHERAMARMQSNQALQDQYRKMAEADLSQVKERGMANWGPLLTGIIGAAAGASGNAGLMQGLGMLGNVIERSAAAKAQNAATTFEGHLELGRQAMADSTNAVDAGTKLMAQEHELAARDLERIAQETSIPVYRETALRLAQGARDQGLQLRQAYYAAEAGRQESIEARKAKANKPKLTITDLEALAQSGQATPDQMKQLLDLRKTAADIDKANRPEKETGEQPTQRGAEVLAGYHVDRPDIWDSLEKPVKTKFQQGQAVIPSTLAKMDELQKLVETHGTETWPTKAKAAMQALKASLLGDLKEAEELGALDNGVSRLVDEQIGDPTAWNFGLGNWVENADGRISKTRELVADKARRKANAYGLVTKELGSPTGSEPHANAPALKTLRRKGQ